jgi:hypothetical protein
METSDRGIISVVYKKFGRFLLSPLEHPIHA